MENIEIETSLGSVPFLFDMNVHRIETILQTMTKVLYSAANEIHCAAPRESRARHQLRYSYN